MIPMNPGNLLPFYEKRRYQRHRLAGQDRVPFGLVAPRTKLIPFQVYVDGGDADTDTIVLEMFSPVNDATVVTVDETLLTREALDDGSGYWVTWYGDQTLDQVPDCGFWYVRLTIEGVEYYSEVLELKNICGDDDIRLEIVADSCSVDGSNLIFSVQGYAFTAPGYTYSLQGYTLGWGQISASELYEVTAVEGNEYYDLRIQVTTVCGLIITRTYKAQWTSGDACNTLVLNSISSATNTASVGNNPSWRIVATNSGDKGNVLYQGRYKQKMYLEPIWDVPEVRREVETEVNGDGDEVRRFTRTVERKRFEFADVPDYAIGFLSKVGDLSSVVLEEVETLDTITMQEIEFESRRQGVSLNIGVITFKSEAEAYSGCQEDYILA